MRRELLCVKIKPEVLNNIKKLANNDNRTVSDYMRLIIERMFTIDSKE